MNRKIALLASTVALITGITAIAAERGLIEFRTVVFDTTFLQGRKGVPELDDILCANLKEKITLSGVFSIQPKHHADVCMLIKSTDYALVAARPHHIKSFNENIYSDVVLRLKDDSLCRVQHSYRKDDGLTIRVVRDGLMTYIRPNKPDAGDGK